MANLVKMCSTENPATSSSSSSSSSSSFAHRGRTRSRSKSAVTPRRSTLHCHIATVKDKLLPPEERFAQLVKQLIDSPKTIDSSVKDGMTALHHSVLEGDEMCTKALIVFGADINALNHFDQTPLDIALENQRLHEALVPLLLSVGCECGTAIKRRQLELAAGLYPSPQWQIMKAMAEESSSSLQGPSTPCVAASEAACLQDAAVVGTGEEFKQEMQSSFEFSEKEGNRILSLDGGGVRGLIQIEVLSEIERITGNKITEIFDWIIGTSTGGIIALLLVYRRRTVHKLRQIYFKLKDQVFSNSKMGGYAYNSEELERLLKEEFGEMKMSDVKHPKVLITAVSKASTQPKLHFFNNCFGDEFSTQPVWKVARYTSAAPMYFTEFENYVDGGVLANNPCDEGLIRIQGHYRNLGVQIPIARIVSIGCGVYPARDLGRVDVHQFFSFGVHWFNRTDTLTARSSNLLRLLSNALLESEAVAERCRAHCAQLNLPFHRLNPQLSEEVVSGETNCCKIVDMLAQSKTWLHTYGHMDTLGPLLMRPLPLQGLCCSLFASM